MLSKFILSSLASVASVVSATERSYSTYQPSETAVEAAAATALTNHITSDVKGGKLFDRFVVIWLENTDYDKAYDNDDMQALAKEGIILSNYWGLSHPSQENYLGAVTGDYLALDNDNFVEVPANVSSLIDLLDTKGISWSEYQEHMPYSGYEGFEYLNQETEANDYVRKHNPVASLLSVSEDANRLGNVKNFTEFYVDLENQTLPQWMFITPNMTNDGHDTTIAVASSWARTFLTPLLNNSYFMENTLILLTFDENETYTIPNKVFGLLLGGVIKDSEKGTEDATFYNHYSEISTVEDNWNLPHLGRFDIDANVFKPVADVSGWQNEEVDTTNLYNNESYTGYFNDDTIPLPVPNCTAINKAGQGVLPEVEKIWGDLWRSQIASSSSSAVSSSNSVTSSESSVATTTSSTTKAGNGKGRTTSTTNKKNLSSSTATSTASSAVPSCTALGTSVSSFLSNVESKYGSTWKSYLQNPSSIKETSSIPLCEIEQEGKKIIQSILTYVEQLEADILGNLFHFDVNSTTNSSNSSNGTASSSASSSSAGAGATVGATVGVIAGGLLAFLQLI